MKTKILSLYENAHWDNFLQINFQSYLRIYFLASELQ